MVQEGTLHEDCISAVEGASTVTVLVRNVVTSGIWVPMACSLSALLLVLFHAQVLVETAACENYRQTFLLYLGVSALYS